LGEVQHQVDQGPDLLDPRSADAHAAQRYVLDAVEQQDLVAGEIDVCIDFVTREFTNLLRAFDHQCPLKGSRRPIVAKSVGRRSCHFGNAAGQPSAYAAPPVTARNENPLGDTTTCRPRTRWNASCTPAPTSGSQKMANQVRVARFCLVFLLPGAFRLAGPFLCLAGALG